ncbi:MAG: tetratricopeptide repeat protein [Bacteroidota bacterium]
MKHVSLVILAALLVFNVSEAQQDSAAFRAATAIQNPDEKLKALEELVKQYPESKLKGRSYDQLFTLHKDKGNEQSALDAAHKYLETLPPDSRMSPYNRIAWALAEKGMGLDSALAYATRAEELAKQLNSRQLSGIRDTRAYTFYRLGRHAEAEELQRIAIKGNEDDQEFLTHLALFEYANGKRREALSTVARALFVDAGIEYRGKFLQWSEEEEPDQAKRDELKKSIITSVVRSFTDTLQGAKLIAMRSRAAAFMADLGVDVKTARQWATEANGSLNESSPVEDVVNFKQRLATVLAADNDEQEALEILVSIRELASPYESKYWLTLGTIYENTSNTEKAIGAYLDGLIALNPPEIRSKLEPLYAKEYGSTDGIAATLDSLKKEGAEFHAGHYGKQTTPTGKVILAELFTGADCGPCASSDIAFDALSEYYPRSVLAIVEYHVHVPGPDPMTTNESWERYNWYSGDGTPTAVFEGRESLLGGGPKVVAKNRFSVYQYAIRKFESAKPQVDISLTVKHGADDVTIGVSIAPNENLVASTNHVLHIALVEKSVEYTGSNGIPKHIFAVRKLIEGAGGVPVPLDKKNVTLSRTINLPEVEKSIQDLMNNPSTQPSWQKNRGPFTSWRGQPKNLSRSNLAVVAWVQNLDTKEVLQATYQDVPAELGQR